MRGTHFKRLILHSNGATVGQALLRQGIITADAVEIMGGDRSWVGGKEIRKLVASKKVKTARVWLDSRDPVAMLSKEFPFTPLPIQRRNVVDAGSFETEEDLYAHRLKESLLPSNDVFVHLTMAAMGRSLKTDSSRQSFDSGEEGVEYVVLPNGIGGDSLAPAIDQPRWKWISGNNPMTFETHDLRRSFFPKVRFVLDKAHK